MQVPEWFYLPDFLAAPSGGLELGFAQVEN